LSNVLGFLYAGLDIYITGTLLVFEIVLVLETVAMERDSKPLESLWKSI